MTDANDMHRPATLALALPVALAAQTFTAAAMFAPSVLAPAASLDIGVPASAVGVMTSIIYLAAAFAAPQAGARVARFGALRVSQIGLLIAALGLALATIAHPLMALLAAVVIGLGYGPSTPSGSALLAERTPLRVFNLVMSIRQMGVPLGGALAGVALPWLILAAGWRVAALFAAATCVLIAAALQTVRARFDHPLAGRAVGKTGFIDALRIVLAHRALRRVSFSAFLLGGVQLCYASFLVVFLVEHASMSMVRSGAVLSAGMLAGMVGRLAWGALADWVGDARKVLSGLSVVTALCAALMTQVSAQWPYAAVVLLAMVFGACTLGWNGVYIAELARLAPPGKVAAVTGASLFFAYGGAVAVPPLFALARLMSEGYVLPFAGLTLLALAGVVFLARRA
ncbi:MAG: MFS transporter [Betaproteobacteria bacterium]|nr:MFS transporter [Betaproteobacteria bacterium]